MNYKYNDYVNRFLYSGLRLISYCISTICIQTLLRCTEENPRIIHDSTCDFLYHNSNLGCEKFNFVLFLLMYFFNLAKTTKHNGKQEQEKQNKEMNNSWPLPSLL